MTDMTTTAVTLVLFLTFAAFTAKRMQTYLHLYQQEEYDSPRFLGWIASKLVVDKRLSISLLIIYVCSFATLPIVSSFLTFLAFALAAFFEKDPKKDSKKKLAMTKRAQRIYYPALTIAVAAGAWCFFVTGHHWIWIVNVHIIPFTIMLSNLALKPYEAYVQQQFWNEAHEKVQALRPKVIAITGSFGKTSVKHILGHILKMNAPTLITPGSVNTPMGITRIVREQLDESHKYFVVEMGAYGPGSIERLCKLTPPDMGIITAIGHAHYERFKTLDTVAETKYELAESVLRKDDGIVIAHERTLRFEHALTMRNAHKPQFIICGEKEPKSGDQSFLQDGDVETLAMTQMQTGLLVQFKWKNIEHEITAPLYGIHHGHNLVLAFITALQLGIDAKDIQTALSRLPQIQHRLEVKRQNNGSIVIDDAYNSNPAGFSSALELLGTLGQEGRKILITPGMVELGKAHTEAHEKIGNIAGKVCDIAIVVQSERIPSFVSAFKTNGHAKPLLEVRSFAQAQDWVNSNAQEGDVILVENDLPDLYERVPKL